MKYGLSFTELLPSKGVSENSYTEANRLFFIVRNFTCNFSLMFGPTRTNSLVRIRTYALPSGFHKA